MLGRSRRAALAATLILVLGMTGPGSAAAAGDGGGLLGILDLNTQTQIDDLFASEDPTILSSDSGTTHFGPFESDTTDSTTCGPDWAADHVFRFFMVKVISQGGRRSEHLPRHREVQEGHVHDAWLSESRGLRQQRWNASGRG